MNFIDEVSEKVSKLSAEEIQDLSDEQLLSLAMERPGHPGVYGFLLNPSYFESNDQMAETLAQLLQRLNKVDNVDEKWAKLNGK